MKKITATLEWAKEGYGIWIDELPNIFSYSETVQQAKEKIIEAIELYFDGDPKKPKWLESGFEVALTFEPAALLNYYQHIFTKRALSRLTGINESLLSQYASGLKKPRKKQRERLQNGLHDLSKELANIVIS